MALSRPIRYIMTMTKKVAIIGAGPAGLVAAKSCLEAGLVPVIFEKSSVLSGVWSGGDNGLAWEGMHTNISKWSCMFSDFPWPEKVQDFPLQSEVANYLKNYADAFHVTEHIRFLSEVTNVSQSNHGWNITVNNLTEQFDDLIIASGFFAKPVQPDIDGADIFEGSIIHSSQCRPAHLQSKNHITVYGGSFSGYELAIEFARVSQTPVTHAFKRASWVLSRDVKVENGATLPLDLISYSREIVPQIPPKSVETARQESISFFKKTYSNPGTIHPDLAMSENPANPIFVVVSDEYLHAVSEGKIIPVRGDISHFDQNHLVLNQAGGEKTLILSDSVVMATGYQATLPYLDESLKSKISYDEQDQFMPVLLHDTVWPKDVDNLAFVGFYRGPFFGVMELQARWAAGVFAGKIPAPSVTEREIGLKAAENTKNQSPRPQFPHANYVTLSDKLAKTIGCYPDVKLSDPLYNHVYGGYFLPSHFRLSGANSNRAIVEKIISEIPYPK